MIKDESVIQTKENVQFLKEHQELSDDKNVVLAAVQQNGLALNFASDELKNDKEIVLMAVKKYGIALQFASTELRKDKEVVLIAVRKDIYACHYSLLEGYQTFDEIVEKEWRNSYFLVIQY